MAIFNTSPPSVTTYAMFPMNSSELGLSRPSTTTVNVRSRSAGKRWHRRHAVRTQRVDLRLPQPRGRRVLDAPSPTDADRFDPPDYNDMRQRFRSHDDEQFRSAFLELYLHDASYRPVTVYRFIQVCRTLHVARTSMPTGRIQTSISKPLPPGPAQRRRQLRNAERCSSTP